MSSPTFQNICQELVAEIDAVIFPFAVEQIAQVINSQHERIHLY